MSQKNTFLIAILVIVSCCCIVLIESKHECAVIVVNTFNKTINFHEYESNNGKSLYSKTLNTTVTPYLVAFDTKNELFIYQNSTTGALSFVYAMNATEMKTLEISSLVLLKNAASLYVDGTELYVLMSNSAMKSSGIVNYSEDDDMYFVKIHLITGIVTKLYASGDNSALIGALTMSSDEIYYILGPYSSYALVSQDRDTGEVDNIVPIRDEKSGAILLPTNIFYSRKLDTLFATLNSEETDASVLAMIDPDSGTYKTVFHFQKEFGIEGKVMQRMISFNEQQQILYGWFANSSGSFSKLFLIHVEHGNLISMFDYNDQQGNWKAIGFNCSNILSSRNE
jgi:hypothetical protein